ncbi:MAG TPA: bifunctional UDP-N-acetylglucosamine diphosphorylase/glucosamine-1-phosphate N-acetyltransferase GlmU [Burkholderiales bacterium]|nr:bifunctional UDP-N-acetylglucosamine diphosphorylase/glucosamine-1-phosphate N-acetyltransferase GlmU [Burkholderiales bacterium]
MSVNVVILAAGQGKRMHSQRPKVLHALAGRSMISHVITAAAALSPTRVCVVYGHGGERVRESVAGCEGLDIAFARQEPQLGTGHAVQQALPHLTDTPVTLVLYGDVPLIRAHTLQKLVDASQDSIAVLTAHLEDPTGYGRIVRDDDGRVREIVEEKDTSPEQKSIREINTGLMALPTARLASWLTRIENHNAQQEYYLTDVIKLGLQDGVSVSTVGVSSVWESMGVNSRSQLAQLERVYQRDYAQQLLERGVALADPNRIDVRGTLACGEDVSIDVNCVFEGEVSLGDGVHIGAHCVLKNVSIAAGARVEPFCHLDSAQIGVDCRIGPYARIRPGTRLAEDVHIGNFVEVKASDIAAGSKANHLAYIGDTTIGVNVNIGAGTITCNYDGANKHRTVIEDDVFIGSDTQLVAPVTVRRGATVGAGATITSDVPAGTLALSRAKQISIRGWKRPNKKGAASGK